MEKAAGNAGWLQELRGEHVPETEEYGISSFVYKATKPFNHQKLLELLNENHFGGVVLSKGFAWTDNRPELALIWSQAGTIMNLDPYGYWSVNEDKSYKGEQKIVFIGIDMDKAEISKKLDEALI